MLDGMHQSYDNNSGYCNSNSNTDILQSRNELNISNEQILEKNLSCLQTQLPLLPSCEQSRKNYDQIYKTEQNQKNCNFNDANKINSSETLSKGQEYKKTILEQFNLRLRDSKISQNQDKKSSTSLSINLHKLSGISLNNTHGGGIDLTKCNLSMESGYCGGISANINSNDSLSTIGQQQPLSYKIYNEILNNSKCSSGDRKSLKRKIIDKINQRRGGGASSGSNEHSFNGLNGSGELNEHLRVTQDKIDQITKLIKAKTMELDTSRKTMHEELIGRDSFSSGADNTTDVAMLRTELFNLKRKLEDIQKKKSEKANVEVLKETLRKQKNDLNSAEAELKKILDEIEKQQHDNQIKEQEIDQEYHPQIKQFELALDSIKQQKLNIHSKLSEIMMIHDQNLEQKATLKEDLNGKLLQRAELVAQREELDQIYEEMKSKYKVEIQFAEEDAIIKEEIMKFSKALNDKTIEKKKILPKLDLIISELTSLNDQTFQVEKSLQLLANEKVGKIKVDNQEMEIIESFINNKTQELGIPEIEKIFTEICQTYGDHIEIKILKNQLRIIEDEEQKMTENHYQREQSLQSQLKRCIERNNIDQYNHDEIQSKLEYLNTRHILRKDVITKWKLDMQDCLIKKENNGKQMIPSKEVFMTRIDELLKEKNISRDEQIKFHEALINYFQAIEKHEVYMHEKSKEEMNLQEKKKMLDANAETLRQTKMVIDEELRKIDEEFSKYAVQKKNLEQKLQEKRTIAEHHLQKESDIAFNAYLQQQSSIFEAISRTYGQKTAQNLKKEHHREFFEITRNNQIKRMEKFRTVQKDLKYLDEAIQNNIKTVDEEILPSLRKLVQTIADGKNLIKALKKQHVALIETEDEITGQLTNLNNHKAAKIKTSINNIHENEKHPKAIINNYKDQKKILEKKIQKLNEEINIVENQLIENDNYQTFGDIEEINLNNEIKIIESKLEQIASNNNLNKSIELGKQAQLTKSESEIEKTEKELRSLRKELENLDLLKISLEQRIIEQNFLLDGGNHTSSLALNIDQTDIINQSFTDEFGYFLQNQNNSTTNFIMHSSNSNIPRSNSINENEFSRTKSNITNQFIQELGNKVQKTKQQQQSFINVNEKKSSSTKENNRNYNQPLQMTSKSKKNPNFKGTSKLQHILGKNTDKPKYTDENEIPINLINQKLQNNCTLPRAKSVPKTLSFDLNPTSDYPSLGGFSPKTFSVKNMVQKLFDTSKHDLRKNINGKSREVLGEKTLHENVRYASCDNQQNLEIINSQKSDTKNESINNKMCQLPLQKQSVSKMNNKTLQNNVLNRSSSSPNQENNPNIMINLVDSNHNLPTYNTHGNKYPLLYTMNETNHLSGNEISMKEFQEGLNLNGNMSINITNLMNIGKPNQYKTLNKDKLNIITKRTQKYPKSNSLETSLHHDTSLILPENGKISGIETTKEINKNSFFRNYAVINDCSSTRRALLEGSNTPGANKDYKIQNRSHSNNNNNANTNNNNNPRSHSLGINGVSKIGFFEDQSNITGHNIRPTNQFIHLDTKNGIKSMNMNTQQGIFNSTCGNGDNSIQFNNMNKNSDISQANNTKKAINHEGNALNINCKQCKEKGGCMAHKRIFKFNMENSTLAEINLFEVIKPLLEGGILFKKFASYQSLKKAAFDPLLADQYPPESCGYGLRSLKLNHDLDKIEIRHGVKFTLEVSINVDSLLRPIVPQCTLDILKFQKRIGDPQLAQFLSQNGSNNNIENYPSIGKAFLQKQGNNLDRYLSCTYYPFSLILDKGGRLEFIAQNYTTFKEWINGFNLLIKNKKILNKLKNKIEIYYL